MTNRTSSVPRLVEPVAEYYGSDFNRNWPGIAYEQSYRHSGVDIKGFHALKKRGGLLPVNPFYSIETEFLQGSCHWDLGMIGHTNSYHAGGAFVDIGVPYYPDATQLAEWGDSVNRKHLVQKALNGLLGQMDLLTFLAEAKEIPGLLMGLAHKIPVVLQRQSPKQLARIVADNYLELQFGWQPLINDLKDIYQTCSKPPSKEVKNYRTSRSGSGDPVVIQRIPVTSNVWTGTWVLQHNISCRAKGSAVAQFRKTSFSFDPVVTGWELIKFSWLIDYVIGIGDALSAATASIKLPNAVCSSGYALDVVSAGNLEGCRPIDGWQGTSSYTTLTRTSVRLRTPEDASFVPQFNYSNMGLQQSLNTLAVVVQRILSKNR